MPRRSKSLIGVDDLRRLITVADPQISPCGARVAFIRKEVGAKQKTLASIWMAAADGPKAPRRFTKGPKDSHPTWRPDSGALAFVRGKKGEPSQIALIDIERGGEARALTKLPEGTFGAMAWSPDGTRIAFSWRETESGFTENAKRDREKSGASPPPRVIDHPWYRLDGDGYFGSARHRLFVMDVRRSIAARMVFEDTLGDFSFAWAPDGASIAVACDRDPDALFNPGRSEIVLVDPTGRSAVRAIAGLPPGPKATPQWSPDGTQLAWAGRRGAAGMYDTANVELWCATVDRAAPSPRAKGVRSLTGRTDYCLMAATLSDSADAAFVPWLRWAADGHSLLMRIGWQGAGRIASVDTSGKTMRLHTDGSAELVPASISLDGRRVAMIRSAPTEPPEVFVAEVDGASFPLRPLTSFNLALSQRVVLAVPTEHWVKSGAVRVHTWVMKPPKGAPRRNGAAVLEVHGGPHAQYGNAFFHELQLLAAQGYTVVYSNPRGSKGYGAKFCAAIRGQWGTADWDDIRAVTAFMKKLPGTSARRLGIMGGSYGGYMSTWAIGHTHTYRAAITDRCVSNLVSMCGSSDYPEIPDLYWRGVAWDRPEALWRSSPIAYFKGVRTPTLIIHSEGDLRCNVEQSEQVHAALTAQGVPCRFVRYPKETSHGMSRSGPIDLREHRLKQILEWWETHLAS